MMKKQSSELIVFTLLAFGVIAGAAILLQSVTMYDKAISALSANMNPNQSETIDIDNGSGTFTMNDDGIKLELAFKQAKFSKNDDGDVVMDVTYDVTNTGSTSVYPIFRISGYSGESTSEELPGKTDSDDLSQKELQTGELVSSSSSFVVSSAGESDSSVPDSITLSVSSIYDGALSVKVPVPESVRE